MNIVFLISPIIILIRLLRGKESLNRFREKLSFSTKKRLKGKLIWFHGASVGELLSIVPLIKELEKDKNVDQILVTSNTLSSSTVLSKIKLKKTTHQFFPIDTTHHTEKFLNHWKPSVAFFIDSEIWPNMITSIKEKSISLVLLNARITQKSLNRWLFFSKTAGNLFGKFDMCLSSSIKNKKNLKLIGAKNIKFIGNLKFIQYEKNQTLLKKEIKKFFLSKKVWCASSTHNIEEKICGNVHKKLKKKYNNLLTVIIPRHISRTKKIKNEMLKMGLKVHVHNSKNRINPNTDIYLVNTYGATELFFDNCKIIFLGGSLIKHGGQNPLEPARYGCNILHGPYVWNFTEIYQLLNKYGLTTKVDNFNEIITNLNKNLNKKSNTKNLEKRIKKLGTNILNLTMKEIVLFTKQ